MAKKVAVIGAGPSGLISTKICLENGLDVVCFEITSDIGGIWNYDTALIEGKGSVMKTTVINSSKENMAFSDFPAPDNFANYMHNKKLLEYFRLYAKNFNLYEKIKFNTKVNRIVQADNYDITGQWCITYNQANSGDKTEIFDALMICIGHHAAPNIPKIETLNGVDAKFKGEVEHSWKYRDPYKYIDKKVLVVGIGNSGGDIAVELSRIASEIYLSTRHGAWCVPRSDFLKGGLPGDYSTLSRIKNLISQLFPNTFHSLRRKVINKRFDHLIYGLRPTDEKEHHVFVNDDLPNRIASGTVILKPNFKEFTENSCIFEDGSIVKDIDTVILATGYKIGFPLLDDSIINVNNNWVNLYKYVFPPQLKHPTLCVMGCIQPLGSINSIVELQARWATSVITGQTILPSKSEMDKDIQNKALKIKARYVESPRHTIQVDFIDYLDEIANIIGCKPNLVKYFFTDFKLWSQIVFNGITPYQYRLNGPGANFDLARRLILTQDDSLILAFGALKYRNYLIGFLKQAKW